MAFSIYNRLIFYRIIIGLFLLFIVFQAGSYYHQVKNAPDLHRLYMQSMQVSDQPPVVFIHGITGSKLRHTQTRKEFFPGNVSRIITSNYSDLAFKINPDSLETIEDNIEAYEINDSVIGQDFYGKIIHTLADVAEYNLLIPGQSVDKSKKNYYVFYYDWRQDNARTAAKLADFIDQIRLDYADPDLKVDIVAHSMGGLISRYYIRYGREDVLDDNDFPVNMYGGQRVRRVILLGTPNLGSLKIVKIFIEGLTIGGTDKIHSETLATMPSLYQLLPHALVDWIITHEGKVLERDIFDVNIWRRFQWSIFDPEVRKRISSGYVSEAEAEKYLETMERFFEKRLERARRFVWSLTVPLPKEHPKLVVFGGSCHLTPARIIVEEAGGISHVRMSPDEISSPVNGIDYNALLLEPGDGSVTKASLLGRDVLDPSVRRHEYNFFPLDHSVFLCEKHNKLTGNINFQDNLLNELLSRD